MIEAAQAEYARELDELRQRAEVAVGDLRQARETIIAHEAEMDHMTITITDLNSNLEALKLTLQEARTESISSLDHGKLADAEVYEMTVRLTAVCDLKDGLEKQLQNALDERNSLESYFENKGEKLKREKRALQDELIKLREENRHKTASTLQLEHSVSSHGSRYTALEIERDRLRERLTDASKAFSDLKLEKLAVELKMEAQNRQVQAALDRKQQDQEAMQDSRIQNMTLKQDLVTLQREKQALRNTFTRVVAEKDDLIEQKENELLAEQQQYRGSYEQSVLYKAELDKVKTSLVQEQKDGKAIRDQCKTLLAEINEEQKPSSQTAGQMDQTNQYLSFHSPQAPDVSTPDIAKLAAIQNQLSTLASPTLRAQAPQVQAMIDQLKNMSMLQVPAPLNLTYQVPNATVNIGAGGSMPATTLTGPLPGTTTLVTGTAGPPPLPTSAPMAQGSAYVPLASTHPGQPGSLAGTVWQQPPLSYLGPSFGIQSSLVTIPNTTTIYSQPSAVTTSVSTQINPKSLKEMKRTMVTFDHPRVDNPWKKWLEKAKLFQTQLSEIEFRELMDEKITGESKRQWTDRQMGNPKLTGTQILAFLDQHWAGPQAIRRAKAAYEMLRPKAGEDTNEYIMRVKDAASRVHSVESENSQWTSLVVEKLDTTLAELNNSHWEKVQAYKKQCARDNVPWDIWQLQEEIKSYSLTHVVGSETTRTGSEAAANLVNPTGLYLGGGSLGGVYATYPGHLSSMNPSLGGGPTSVDTSMTDPASFEQVKLQFVQIDPEFTQFYLGDCEFSYYQQFAAYGDKPGGKPFQRPRDNEQGRLTLARKRELGISAQDYTPTMEEYERALRLLPGGPESPIGRCLQMLIKNLKINEDTCAMIKAWIRRLHEKDLDRRENRGRSPSPDNRRGRYGSPRPDYQGPDRRPRSPHNTNPRDAWRGDSARDRRDISPRKQDFSKAP